MTHDELLERLDELKYDVGDSGMNEEYKAIYALRTVVELHKPDDSIPPYSLKYCTCEEMYPCGTIEAIEKELK